MSADSGKPDAGEWAKKIRHCVHHGNLDMDEARLVLADFQRETLLWVAQQFICFCKHGHDELECEACAHFS